jgi:hypothetical protein
MNSFLINISNIILPRGGGNLRRPPRVNKIHFLRPHCLMVGHHNFTVGVSVRSRLGLIFIPPRGGNHCRPRGGKIYIRSGSVAHLSGDKLKVRRGQLSRTSRPSLLSHDGYLSPGGLAPRGLPLGGSFDLKG